jgi:hypothetical protein
MTGSEAYRNAWCQALVDYLGTEVFAESDEDMKRSHAARNCALADRIDELTDSLDLSDMEVLRGDSYEDGRRAIFCCSRLEAPPFGTPIFTAEGVTRWDDADPTPTRR